ncbi:MAG TPA: PP2C family protein-serine/threonine phosphatase [Acidobacteriaceae bacterium]|nr:PP2C family protein-serine/threonine phosphatase [Acidobacteriaceae bacterium]
MRRIWIALSISDGNLGVPALPSELGAPSLRSKGGMRICLALLLLPLLALSAVAQNAPTTAAPTTTITLGQSIVPLNGPWKFHTGDNPAWADPNFDDSQWETVDLTPKQGSFDPTVGFSGTVPGWTAKGHPGYWGWAWYRIRVRTNAQPGQKLALFGPVNIDDAYQVFADGRLLGGLGRFASLGHPPVVYTSRPRSFALPNGALIAPLNATSVIAFRVWMEPGSLNLANSGGMHDPPLLGLRSAVGSHERLLRLEWNQAALFDLIEVILYLLLAALAISLIFFDRSDPVYLWIAAVFLLNCVESTLVLIDAQTLAITAAAYYFVLWGVLVPMVLAGWVMVWWVWFGLRRPSWLPRLVAWMTAIDVLSALLGRNIFYTLFKFLPHGVVLFFAIVLFVDRLFFLVLLGGIVVVGVLKQRREGWLVLPAALLVGASQFYFEIGFLHIPTAWSVFGTVVTLPEFADFGLAVAIFLLLLRRALLSVRRQREMALDVKQAQEVQQVLIPMALPQIPGLAIESEYRPAREVGGDFFQIVPHPTDGSTLIVAGDVTGHGLQAGMLVALLVGAIRATLQFNPDPLVLLQSLNQRLLGRGAAHATALALRIAQDGACTLANAGHLPPYLNGKEIDMPGALPLGMIEDAEFSLMRFQLAPGDTLTLLSDGVAEAMDERGELFGFERIHALLQNNLSAAQIAAAAQAFGQQDDISVLRIVREPSGVRLREERPILAL